MSGYLLDTNVVSELTKENPNPAVIDKLNARDNLFASGKSEVLEFTSPTGTRCDVA